MAAILWHNEDFTVFLVDIPGSIAAAQVAKGQPVNSHLLSQEALDHTWSMPAPKSAQAARNAEAYEASIVAEVHKQVMPYITSALQQIRGVMHSKTWCEPRRYVVQKDERLDHKYANDPAYVLNDGVDQTVCPLVLPYVQPTTYGVQPLEVPKQFLKSLLKGNPSGSSTQRQESEKNGTQPSSSKQTGMETFRHRNYDGPVHSTVSSQYFHNKSNGIVTLSIQMKYKESDTATHFAMYDMPFCFRIPPHATFLLGDCAKGQPLRDAVATSHYKYDHPKRFDLILMDPPWPNQSAQDTKYYRLANSIDEIHVMFKRMDLDAYMAPGGFVCIWVTNNSKVRELVLGQHGLFDMWGVSLIEEWVWVKTTNKGQPMFDINSKWRKPYEVLLVGQVPCNVYASFPPVGNWHINKRVIAAVPDIHSRKPCLKSVFEKVAGWEEGRYSALEIFGRVCVSGWFTWGDQAMLYNWERHWLSSQPEVEEAEKKKQKENEETGEKAASSEKAVVGEKRKASSLEE